MIYSSNIFRQAIYVLYGNPILFLMPSISISVTTETIFVIGLYNNNNPNYFPFVNMLVLGLFFIAFTITYFQLVITRNIILKKRLRITNSPYRKEIFVLFIIYSIYALILVQMGSYEGDIRKNNVVGSD
jgi:H+/Cl- antiporter ClcA